MQKITLFAILFAANTCFAQSDTTETAAKIYNNALALYKNKDYATALTTAHRALQKLDPKDKAYVGATYLIALCHKKNNSDVNTLRQAYQSVLNIDPNHTDCLTQLGLNYFNSKDFENATLYFQRALTSKPGDAELTNFLTQAKTAQEKVQKGKTVTFKEEQAAADAAKKTSAKPTNKEVETATTDGNSEYISAFNKAATHYNNGSYEEAVLAYKEALKLSADENNPKLLLKIAKSYANINGEEDNAKKFAAKATKNAKSDGNIWFDAGNVYFKIDDKERAIDAYEKADKNGLKSPKLYTQLGVVHHLSQNEDKAAKWFQRAADESPNDPILLYDLGTAYMTTQQWTKGIKALTRSIELDPKHLDAYFNLSRAYYQLFEFDKALEVAKNSLRVDIDFAKGYFMAAKAYGGLRDDKNYEKYLREAYQRDPSLKRLNF